MGSLSLACDREQVPRFGTGVTISGQSVRRRARATSAEHRRQPTTPGQPTHTAIGYSTYRGRAFVLADRGVVVEIPKDDLERAAGTILAAQRRYSIVNIKLYAADLRELSCLRAQRRRTKSTKPVK